MDEFIGKVIERLGGGKTYAIGVAGFTYAVICLFADCWEFNIAVGFMLVFAMLMTGRAATKKLEE